MTPPRQPFRGCTVFPSADTLPASFGPPRGRLGCGGLTTGFTPAIVGHVFLPVKSSCPSVYCEWLAQPACRKAR
jgi:hypothetical protein